MKPLEHYAALSFDCYGTLIDWEAGILGFLRPWTERNGIQADDETLLAAFSRHERHQQETHPARLYPHLLGDVLHGIAADLGITASDVDAQAFGASVGDWPAFDDSHDALAYLGRHYRLIILSNVDRASFAKSNERLGVEFDAAITAEDVGSYKPTPENFRRAMTAAERLTGRDDALLHVGESLHHDIAPAQAMGLPVVWIDRARARGGPRASGALEDIDPPDREYDSMQAFAEAHRRETGAR